MDNPGTDNIEQCRDDIQTSDVILRICLLSFWLAGGSWDIHVPCEEQTLGLGDKRA